MPWCFGTSGFVRTSRMIQCAKCAPEVHTFWPLTTKWSPWSTARVRRLARSEPAPGSEKPWHQISSALRIAGRWRRFCSSVPQWMRVGPTRFRPMLPGKMGARAAVYSSSQMARSISPASRPPVLLGPRDADPARRVHRLLPDSTALERLPIGRHTVVGGVVQAQVGRKVRREPVAELLPETLVLGGEFEVHGGFEPRLVGPPRRCQALRV